LPYVMRSIKERGRLRHAHGVFDYARANAMSTDSHGNMCLLPVSGLV